MRKRKLIIGTLFGAIIIFLLYRQIDLGKLRNLKITFNYSLLIIPFLLTIFCNIIRAKRFNYILNNSLKLVDIFKITTFYNLYTRLFPGGLGELSFIYLIKKKVKKPIPKGLSSIIITRVYDVLIMAVFLLGSLVIFSDVQIDRGKYIFIAGVIIFIAFLIIRYLHKIVERLGKIFSILLKYNPAWADKIKNNLKLTADTLKDNRNKNLTLFLITLLFWSVSFLTVQLFCASIGLRLNYFEAVLLGSISAIVTMIPINTFGGFGFKEGGLTLGLILIGIAKEQAIIYSFLIHLLSITLALGLAFIGILLSINFIKVKRHFLSKF